MKPDKRQLRLFEDAPDRMELKDYQKKKTVRKPKRRGFNYAADVEIGQEVDVSTIHGFHPGRVTKKDADIRGTTTFTVECDDEEYSGFYRLGELYRRMK